MKIRKKIQAFLQTRKLKRNQKDKKTKSKYRIEEVRSRDFSLVIGTTRSGRGSILKGSLIDVLV
ncbi:hypothetical protein [Paraclostridium sordellii]|uniref:hypothetical protein n=1 Tax=Paraclostridium sordellii TaxID=1505 RepID=UPI000E4802B6|nr:hypothetical protein [Paeniclostridium sordellii]RGX09361.1 hypothetical protein DWV40_07640 [Paeniclostridium sordellii]